MKYRAGTTAERVRELFTYESLTGIFTRKVATSRNTKVGEIAGSIDPHGYRCIAVDGAIYKAHRLAWLYVHGEWPALDLDHINRVRDDNRIANLREVSRSENCQNSSGRVDNKSGHRGVYWNKQRACWVAGIGLNGKVKYLGLFSSIDDAAAAYKAAALQIHTCNPVAGVSA